MLDTHPSLSQVNIDSRTHHFSRRSLFTFMVHRPTHSLKSYVDKKQGFMTTTARNTKIRVMT